MLCKLLADSSDSCHSNIDSHAVSPFAKPLLQQRGVEPVLPGHKVMQLLEALLSTVCVTVHAPAPAPAPIAATGTERRGDIAESEGVVAGLSRRDGTRVGLGLAYLLSENGYTGNT